MTEVEDARRSEPADFTKICTGCGYVITAKYLSLNGEDWHSSCVLCDECGVAVFEDESAKLHTQDGKIYCKDCVTQLFQVCADCGQPAKKYVKALGKIWHTFHFKCASCNTILDSYAEVDGAAYCQPCHQRMSAKSFTKAKRRSFGTEKREAAAAAARPAWAPKRAPGTSTAPKSALDVMHKSWFVSGLKKPAATPAPAPSPHTPSSPPSTSSVSPKLGSSSTLQAGAAHRQYVPSPTPGASPLSPQLQNSIAPKPRGYVPPLSSSPASSTTTRGAGSLKPAGHSPPTSEPPKPAWMVNSKPGAAPAKPAGLKSVSAIIPSSGGAFTRTGAATPTGSHSPNGTTPGYTSITFESNATATKKGSFRNQQDHPTASSPVPDGMPVGDVLEAILRPMSEDEVGSLAFQSIPLLAQIHREGRLHNNVTHRTLRISNNGTVILVEAIPDDDAKSGANSIKFRPPENSLTVYSDVYSLGVCLWTSADYLLDEEEEPALSADFCDFIGFMTEDEPEQRLPLAKLQPYVEKYRDISAPILSNLIREVERKKVFRQEIQETTVAKQKNLGKLLIQEIGRGVKLKKVDRNSQMPSQRPPNPYELMCLYIKTFNAGKLKKVDLSKLPVKQYKLNPRERLLQNILAPHALKRALVVAGYDINTLIMPVPNHPTYGTVFRDISSMFTIPRVSAQIAQQIAARYSGEPPDLFVATPTDGGVFFASLVAQLFNRGVIVLQNAGRLPRKMEKHTCGYETLGYVSHSLELQLQKNLIKEGTRVVLIDEMLVNGGILEAARLVLRETGAKLKEVLCIVELEGFGGRQRLRNFECNVHAMYVFNDNPQVPR